MWSTGDGGRAGGGGTQQEVCNKAEDARRGEGGWIFTLGEKGEDLQSAYFPDC